MRVSQCLQCTDFPCAGVKHECFTVPAVRLDPAAVSLVMISEAAPENRNDFYYSKGKPLFAETTLQAFRDAGAAAVSLDNLTARGIYLTTAVKCAKQDYTIPAETVRECSRLLEKELALFPKVRVLMLMGDVAIKALNFIAARAGEKRVVPAGSTYKLRGSPYFFRGARVFPSYLQAGPSFFIEKSKRRMITEDIAAALPLCRA